MVYKNKEIYLEFEKLYEENFAKVNRYFRYKVKNVWDADDLTAETFIRAYSKLDSYRAESGFVAWLFSIARNVYIDYMRKKQGRKNREFMLIGSAELDLSVGVNLEKQICLNETLAEIREMLDELPEKYGEVIALRYAADLKFAKIAEILGKTEDAVRMMHHRAIKHMRKKYEKQKMA